MQPQQTPAKKKGNPVVGAVAVLVLVALCGVGGVVLFTGGDETPQDPTSANRAIDAEVMCEQFIEKRLKAPATAEYTDTKTSKNGATYTVLGAVDSENTFGAKIRSQYTCVVTDAGNDKWTLVDLKMSE